jgi:hypothetical protein
LFLNVYAPHVPADAPWAVMVWFPGGGFSSGNGGAFYSGSDLVVCGWHSVPSRALWYATDPLGIQLILDR